MRKRCFQVKQKLKILRDVKDATTREENRLTLADACKQHKITCSMYYQWREKEEELRATSNKKAYSLNKGVTPQMPDEVEKEVYDWLLDLKQRDGTVVTYSHIVERMSLLDTEFANKSAKARLGVVKRFCKRHKYRCVRKKRNSTTSIT